MSTGTAAPPLSSGSGPLKRRPLLFRHVILGLSRTTPVHHLVTGTALFRPAVNRFIAGESLADAVSAATDLNARGLLATVDLLGEATVNESLARRAADGYVEGHTFVRVDMEDSGRLPAIEQVFDRVWEGGARDIGIALQAYLYRTPEDAERYASRGVGIRLCKGAYAEAPDLVIATHDERLISRARALAAARAVSPQCFEFQMLFGIRRDLQEALVRDGYRVRVYVPFGTHWYPYFMRRLAERPANMFFLAKHLIRR